MLFQRMMYQILQQYCILSKSCEVLWWCKNKCPEIKTGALPAALESNLQHQFTHLPAQEHPAILTKSWGQWLSFRARQIYTDLS